MSDQLPRLWESYTRREYAPFVIDTTSDDLLGGGAYALVFRASFWDKETATSMPCAVKVVKLKKQAASDLAFSMEEAAFTRLEQYYTIQCGGAPQARTYMQETGQIVTRFASMKVRDVDTLAYDEEVHQLRLARRRNGDYPPSANELHSLKECYTQTLGLMGLDLLPPVTLDAYIKHHRKTDGRLFSQEMVVRLAYQAAVAVETMHAAGVAHNDVKADNIAYDIKKQQLTLFDLGFATIHPEAGAREMARITSERMSPLFAAPELLLQKGPFNPFSADIWALGQVFYSLMFLHTMFNGKASFLEHLKTLSNPDCVEERKPAWIKTNPAYLFYNDLLSRTACYDPVDRSAADTLVVELQKLCESVCRENAAKQQLRRHYQRLLY